MTPRARYSALASLMALALLAAPASHAQSQKPSGKAAAPAARKSVAPPKAAAAAAVPATPAPAAVPAAVAAGSLPNLQQMLYEIARPGDLILTVGAGDIYRVGEALVAIG